MDGESRAQWEQEIDPLQHAVELYRQMISTKDGESQAFIAGKLAYILPRLEGKDRQQYYDLAVKARRELLPDTCFGSRHVFSDAPEQHACECGDYFLKRVEHGFEIVIREPEEDE